MPTTVPTVTRLPADAELLLGSRSLGGDEVVGDRQGAVLQMLGDPGDSEG